MPITIRGIRITSLTVEQEDGRDKISAKYQLISSNDKVLAKESLTNINPYGTGETFTPSPQTMKALSDAITLYRKDVETSLGIEVE